GIIGGGFRSTTRDRGRVFRLLQLNAPWSASHLTVGGGCAGGTTARIPPMDPIIDLLQTWQIYRQGAQATSLEQRVGRLEGQLSILHQVVLAFAKELRPDLIPHLQAAAPPSQPTPFVTPASGWRVSRVDETSGAEVAVALEYSTEEEAKAEA